MDLSQLKICFLAGTLGQGGAERQLFHILVALRQCGAVPRLLCLSQNEFWEKPIRNLGVPVTWVGHDRSRLKRLFRIMTELRRDPPAVCPSQHFYTSAYAGAAARWLRLRGIGALQSNGFMEVKASGPVGGWLSLHTPGMMTANSRAAIRYAVERHVRPGRLYFLPNAVDTEQLQPGPRHNGNGVRLIAVGSLRPCKRFDRFLSALARLHREGCKPMTGIIVGEGPLKSELQRQARELGLSPAAVEFRGSVADMAPVYREADICVLTSDYEGTPNVLLEAMASGLPVVATRVGGVPEIVRQEENGLLAEAGDEDNLCRALARLANDAQLRTDMGRKARGYVEANHSLRQLPDLLRGLYRLALS